MNLFQAVVLGLVQGLGEFLPISSSAHLIIVPWLFNWPDPGLTFDIALHVGTLVAVAIYFWRDWVMLLTKGFTAVRSKEGRLFWFLVAATIPGGVGGLLLEKKAETVFRAPVLIACMLILAGVLLYAADRKGKKNRTIADMTLKTSLLIGVSQTIAIVPGVSRSGITMSMGLLARFTREDAARFSFLLSAPIIFGAAAVKVPHLMSHPSMLDINFLIGTAVSCISGIVSIGFLLRYVRTGNFLSFAWYRSSWA